MIEDANIYELIVAKKVTLKKSEAQHLFCPGKIIHSKNEDLCTLFHTFVYFVVVLDQLTHWGQVTHICVSKLIIIGSDNGLSPERRQAIIWTIAGILLIGTLGTNFSQILSEIQTFSFKKMLLKMSSAKCRQFCLGLNVLISPLSVRVTSLTLMPMNQPWRIWVNQSNESNKHNIVNNTNESITKPFANLMRCIEVRHSSLEKFHLAYPALFSFSHSLLH